MKFNMGVQKTAHTRIISGILLCCKENANPMKIGKSQALTVIRFVTSGLI